MRIAVNFGFVCAILCVMLGAFTFGQNHGMVYTLGCVLLTFWIIVTPSTRRSGKL